MDFKDIIIEIKNKFNPDSSGIEYKYNEEIYIKADERQFKDIALFLHRKLHSPVMSFFAEDMRKINNTFKIYCVLLDASSKQWFIIYMNINAGSPEYPSIAGDIFTASLFEREMREMFGLKAAGNTDLRRLRLHEEVWPEGYFPLRKDFNTPMLASVTGENYKFNTVDGEGVFEVPVGPVHAGIIGPGHFRFSVAGEPIINLEIRLGFTHRGAEKLFEAKNINDAAALAECVSGDSSFAHGSAFCKAIEKILNMEITEKTARLRIIFLELERMYNHVNDLGGIAVDVGFSMPNALASIIKENILLLNEKLTGSRYLKKVNKIGYINVEFGKKDIEILLEDIIKIEKDFDSLVQMMLSSVSFLDRVDGTGILKKKTAEDLGVLGLAGRASGVELDLRGVFPGPVLPGFKAVKRERGDVFSRLQLRIDEFKESVKIIKTISGNNITGENVQPVFKLQEGYALGYSEGWRGPVLYWVKINKEGMIERCKITDPSFHNWAGLSYAVLGNIIPDFPLCNKSFDLSYSGNDL